MHRLLRGSNDSSKTIDLNSVFRVEDNGIPKLNIRRGNGLETDSLLISEGAVLGRKHEDTFQVFSTIEG